VGGSGGVAASAERLGDAAANVEAAETRRRPEPARAASLGCLKPVFDGRELDFEPVEGVGALVTTAGSHYSGGNGEERTYG
jgi:hypothetical protein